MEGCLVQIYAPESLPLLQCIIYGCHSTADLQITACFWIIGDCALVTSVSNLMRNLTSSLRVRRASGLTVAF
eukprot:30797-Eustigmatos_ZCMA.PRE.1